MDSATLEFLGGLAHELRTPLGAIGGYAELMELGVHGPVTPAQQDGLGRIRRNQALMVSLLNAFMAYAEVAAGDIDLEPQVVSLSQTLDVSIGELSASASSRAVRLERLPDPIGVRSEITEADDAVHADRHCLSAVLREVLRDAIESSPVGGAVQMALSADGVRARVEVRSSGEPINSETRDAAFLPFHRDGKGSRTSASPHALSLPHARLLARRMGGDVLALPDREFRVVVADFPRVA